jgi:glycosyltransferase involved in cell wall biosynthesis
MTDDKRGTIVFLAPGFSEPGGCASHGRKLAEGLAARGWRVHVIARLHSGRRLHRRRASGLTVTEIPGFGRQRLGGALFLALGIGLALNVRKPHAFMAIQLSVPATVASGVARLRRCRRLMIFSTSTGPAGEAAFVRNSRLASLRRAMLSRASVLVAQTDAGAAELRDLLPGARVEVVPTPVRLCVPVPPLHGAQSAVYTGRIVEGKNLDTLLTVWPAVVARIPSAQLTLVGNGAPGDGHESRVKRMIAGDTRLVQSVTTTGWVPDVAPYLERADVFVLPSSSEGMSNALLEACAFGRIVVASDIAGNRAVLGDDYPFLFDPIDRNQFEQILVAALTHGTSRTSAREQILRRVIRFAAASVVQQIEELLTH